MNIETLIASVETSIANGFTTKTAQKDVLDTITKTAEKIQKVYKDTYLAMRGSGTPAHQDFYYEFPAVHVWKAKHVALANSLYPQFSAHADAMTTLAALRVKVKAVEVVKKATVAEVKAAKVAELAEEGNLDILINAMQDVKAQTVELYVDYMAKRIDHAKKQLEASNMYIPKTFSNDHASFIRSMTTFVNDLTSYNYPRVFSAEKEAVLLNSAKESAEFSFLQFMHKMVLKTGANKIAKVSFSGKIWNRCTVTIECVNGETIRLNTSIIVNVSKFGKLFNQWPTRKA